MATNIALLQGSQELVWAKTAFGYCIPILTVQDNGTTYIQRRYQVLCGMAASMTDTETVTPTPEIVAAREYAYARLAGAFFDDEAARVLTRFDPSDPLLPSLRYHDLVMITTRRAAEADVENTIIALHEVGHLVLSAIGWVPEGSDKLARYHRNECAAWQVAAMASSDFTAEYSAHWESIRRLGLLSVGCTAYAPPLSGAVWATALKHAPVTFLSQVN
jgi:hypothetical protein